MLIAITIGLLIVVCGTISYFVITKKPKELQNTAASFETTEVKPASEITDFYVKMPPPEKKAAKSGALADYISKARAEGLTDEQIRLNLKSKGWADKQINEAF